MFSVINALLLRPLPVPAPDHLVRIFQGRYGNTSYWNYLDLQSHSAMLESLAAFSWPNPVALAAPAGPSAVPSEQTWSAVVSGNYFDVLGVRAALGRTFLPEDDVEPGKASAIHCLTQCREGLAVRPNNSMIAFRSDSQMLATHSSS